MTDAQLQHPIPRSPPFCGSCSLRLPFCHAFLSHPQAAKQPRSALQGMTNSQLSAVIRKADLNDDGTLDFSEFKAMLATLVPEQLGVTVHK